MGLENAGLLFLPTTLAPADSPFLKPSWAGNRTAKEPPRGGGHGAGRAGFARSPLPISNRFPRRFAARLKQPREKEGGNLFLGWLLRFSLAEGQEVPLAADRGEEEQFEARRPGLSACWHLKGGGVGVEISSQDPGHPKREPPREARSPNPLAPRGLRKTSLGFSQTSSKRI
ncbi:uncharacterized protein LOC117052950 isoform X2 [Lacerta agilis]|uniref:uncharacterized protein LOC117052950 isoform X2 n=1 Tax=Lacerta agilis TaxID=80427 RepID=UPI001419415F|nr:uncharacterized protein LOC117052950 isoform X2 [Lacerta agilis]